MDFPKLFVSLEKFENGNITPGVISSKRRNNMDTFMHGYHYILNGIFNKLREWKVVGCCDHCDKYIYANDDFIQMCGVPRVALRLQFCSQECLTACQRNYEYLNAIEFKRAWDSQSHEVISQGGFTNIMKFLMKYPDFVTYKGPKLLNLMLNIQKDEELGIISESNMILLNTAREYKIF